MVGEGERKVDQKAPPRNEARPKGLAGICRAAAIAGKRTARFSAFSGFAKVPA
jgi:hypothetical protein